jgi:hypothetical protein
VRLKVTSHHSACTGMSCVTCNMCTMSCISDMYASIAMPLILGDNASCCGLRRPHLTSHKKDMPIASKHSIGSMVQEKTLGNELRS